MHNRLLNAATFSLKKNAFLSSQSSHPQITHLTCGAYLFLFAIFLVFWCAKVILACIVVFSNWAPEVLFLVMQKLALLAKVPIFGYKKCHLKCPNDKTEITFTCRYLPQHLTLFNCVCLGGGCKSIIPFFTRDSTSKDTQNQQFKNVSKLAADSVNIFTFRFGQ